MDGFRDGFKMIAMCAALLGLAAPAAAASGDDETRHDPYAGYRARYKAADRVERVEHRPKLIRTEPLIREHKTYANAPAPVEVRVRTQPSVAAAKIDRSHATVVVDRPVVRIDRYRYEDIGAARVVRNPLLHAEPSTWREKIVEPVTPIRHDRYLSDLRYHRTVPRAVVRIRSSSVYDCYPQVYHRPFYQRTIQHRPIYERPIHRPYYGSHHGWRHHGHHRHHTGGFIRFSHPVRTHCGPSAGFSIYLRF